jgi:uncharacterized protein YeeX (DUF496 family)
MTDTTIASATDEQTAPDEGQVVETVEATAETPQEEYDFLEVTDLGEKYVKVQVDGEEVAVPITEALAGYQRQADYTRKTQELSEQRKQLQFAATLQDALQKDPENTLRLLQAQFGTTQAPVTTPEEEEYLTPEEKQVRELNQRLQALEQERAMEALVKTIDTLQSKYGDEFNADEVVFRANQLGSTDLEAVFKQMAFDKVYAEKASTAKKLAEEQERLNAKRSASIVSGSTSSKSGSAPQSAPPKSVFEAYEQAKRQLGD